MKKNLGLISAVLAAGALLAGNTSQAPTAPTSKAAEASVSRDTRTTKAEQPTPAKPVREVAVRKQVASGPSPYYMEQPYFPQIEQRRRVKYGRHRWVVLG